MKEVAAALHRIADVYEKATVQRKPVDEFFESATESLLCIRKFISRWGLPILVSIPSVLVTVGAISPNAAKALSEFLRAIGAQ